MDYQNRLPPEGINTPGRHPLKEFLRLVFFAVIALVFIGLLLNFVGGRLGGVVPFAVERWVAEKIDIALVESAQDSPFALDPIDSPLEEYLHELAARVQTAMGIEKPMAITLHYSDEDIVNAYALIGGHVYLFNGLLKQLPHENALVMLMAHEFSHVQLRHTVKGVGSGLAVAVGMAILPGNSTVGSPMISFANQLTSTRFSRGMESDADEQGLMAVEKMYGHVNGAGDLFELFMLQRGEDDQRDWETFLSTHPLDADRIEFVEFYALSKGLSQRGDLTALPAQFATWLSTPLRVKNSPGNAD